MTKGLKRGNREIRKPKQDKAVPKTESVFASHIKLASNIKAPRGKA